MEPVIPVVGASLMTVTRSSLPTEQFQEQKATDPGRPQNCISSPKAIGVDLMYRGVAGGRIRAPKSVFYGQHEGWRRRMNRKGARPPVQGRFRKAYPDYDEDA